MKNRIVLITGGASGIGKAMVRMFADRGCQVTVSMKTGEGGRTFGTVSTKEVAEEAKKQLGLDIDKKKMKLDVPIKALGNYIIQIKLHKDVTAELTVKVVEK